MTQKKKIFAINGSASQHSSNERLIDQFVRLTEDYFEVTIFNDLKTLPHFDPERSIDNTPASIIAFRQQVQDADGVLICTPEYVFSIPSGLKNAIEWCVSTTVFSDKPIALITASANGEKGHEELQLIMRTVMASFGSETTLLIRGIKAKISQQGSIIDKNILDELVNLIEAYKKEVYAASV